MITQEEMWALSALTGLTNNAQIESQRLLAARQAMIKLLEDKYRTVFNQQTGEFQPKSEETSKGK